MAIGICQYTKIYEDPVTGVTTLSSFSRVQFTHDASFTAPTTSVIKEDFTSSPNDAFTVAVSYPNGQEPSPTGTTLTGLAASAKAAVVAVFGSSEIPS